MMPLLSSKNLSVKINNKFICEKFSFEIFPGDCVGLLGANGSGKTTWLKTMAGLLKPHDGEIFLNDKNIMHLSRREIALHLGMLFQHNQNNLELTVEEYCLMGRHPHLKKFSSVSFDDKNICLNNLKHMQLENMWNRKMGTLSGGELRRLSIAMLLTQQPKVYLLDEPTNHLDLNFQMVVLDFFKNLSSAGVCMALHNARAAKYFCNKVILLFSDGEILKGTTEELLNTENLSRLYSLSPQWLPILNF